MSSFNNMLGSVWGAVSGTLNAATGVADLASGWVSKHRIIQRHSMMSDVELAVSTKSVETDKQLQRNAEARLLTDFDLVKQERERISQILSQI